MAWWLWPLLMLMLMVMVMMVMMIVDADDDGVCVQPMDVVIRPTSHTNGKSKRQLFV